MVNKKVLFLGLLMVSQMSISQSESLAYGEHDANTESGDKSEGFCTKDQVTVGNPTKVFGDVAINVKNNGAVQEGKKTP